MSDFPWCEREDGALVVIAKCPIPGKSKTRLFPKLGEEGAAKLAHAMLSDVLKSLSQCSDLHPTPKILVYAPGTPEGRKTMDGVFQKLKIPTMPIMPPGFDAIEMSIGLKAWTLLPAETDEGLESSNLGNLLQNTLELVRKLSPESRMVSFLGMDTPNLPLPDIVSSMSRSRPVDALMCPSHDGGYGFLSVPKDADPAKTFANIPWSTPLTGMAQIKALTDQGITVRIGALMHDIDEPGDIEALKHRIITANQNRKRKRADEEDEEKNDSPSNVLEATCNTEWKDSSLDPHPTMFYTKKALNIKKGA